MAWDLTEFFKDKKECLKEINNLNNIYDKILIFKSLDMNNKDNLLLFLKFIEKYKPFIYNFQIYINLLETSDYHNIELNTIKTKFNQINDKIENLIEEILENIDMDSYKNDQDYESLENLIESLRNRKQDEADRTYNLIDTLLSDINSSNNNNSSFKNTFIELFNNYFKSLKESLLTTYEDYVFEIHDELTKDDFKRITSILKTNSYINDSYFEIIKNIKKDNYKINYDDAKKEIMKSLESFGNEYLTILNKTFNNNTIDYNIRKYKSPSNETYLIHNHHAFANVNYDNTLDSAFILAHELGHMMEHNIKYRYKNTSLNEVGTMSELYSLTNELIFGNYLLKKANTLDEKICISKQLIELYYTNLFDATCIAELGLSIGMEFDKNSCIDLKKITRITNKLIKNYNLFKVKNMWIDNNVLEGIDIIYYFYGMVGGVNILNSINDKTFCHRDYFEILKSNNINGFEIFNKLGFNPIDDSTIKKALFSYDSLLENTKDLIYEKELKRK